LIYDYQFSIDVTILDVVMPGMGGMKVLSCIKQKAPLLEILMLTGEGKIEDAIQSFKKGVFDFLLKPVPIQKLISKILDIDKKTKIISNV
jgi:two-component system, OmpR family, response regulator